MQENKLQIIAKCAKCAKKQNSPQTCQNVDSAAVSIYLVILIELTVTVFVNSTKISTNIETSMLPTLLH